MPAQDHCAKALRAESAFLPAEPVVQPEREALPEPFEGDREAQLAVADSDLRPLLNGQRHGEGAETVAHVRRALALRTRWLEAGDEKVRHARYLLGVVLIEAGEHAEGRRLLQGIDGQDALAVSALEHRAGSHFESGELDAAQALFARVRDEAPDRGDRIDALFGLADVALRRGRLDQARALAREALALERSGAESEWEEEEEESWIEMFVAERYLAPIALAQGDFGGALATLERRVAEAEALRARAGAFDEPLTLGNTPLLAHGIAAAAKNDAPEALVRAALATVIATKNVTGDRVAAGLRFRGNAGEEEQSRIRLRELQGRLAWLSLAARPAPELVALAEQELRGLEAALGKRGLGRGAEAMAGTTEQVLAAIPADAALIDISAVATVESALAGEPVLHYVALVAAGGTVAARDLGPVAEIDELVARFRTLLQSPGAGASCGDLGELTGAAGALHERLLGPLEAAIGARRTLLLSLDGQLQLIPWEALHDGGAFIAGRLAIRYLTSPRDLLREAWTQPSSSVVVFADPAFDAPVVADQQPVADWLGGSMARRLKPARIAPLPGTGREADAVSALFAGARVRRGAAATEEALLAVSSPGILHVATHGLFLEDQAAARQGSRALGTTGAAASSPVVDIAPMARSVLLLAGAASTETRASSSGADGFATALELAGLDLTGTQLVVLSACDTGRGEIRLGQGISGLRQALLAAGAETLIASLWKVDDAVTTILMRELYTRLAAGVPRAEALREAAAAVRASHPHPYYWAPFVLVGRDGAIRR